MSAAVSIRPVLATAGRLAVLAGWLCAVYAIGMNTSSEWAWVYVLPLSLLVGIAIGRWWALAAAPLVAFAGLVLGGVLSSPPGELGAFGLLYVTAIYVLFVNVPLALGIALHRMARGFFPSRQARHRSSP